MNSGAMKSIDRLIILLEFQYMKYLQSNISRCGGGRWLGSMR